MFLHTSNVLISEISRQSDYVVGDIIFHEAADWTICNFIDPLSANPTKWSNTLKQLVGFCRRIV